MSILVYFVTIVLEMQIFVSLKTFRFIRPRVIWLTYLNIWLLLFQYSYFNQIEILQRTLTIGELKFLLCEINQKLRKVRKVLISLSFAYRASSPRPIKNCWVSDLSNLWPRRPIVVQLFALFRWLWLIRSLFLADRISSLFKKKVQIYWPSTKRRTRWIPWHNLL